MYLFLQPEPEPEPDLLLAEELQRKNEVLARSAAHNKELVYMLSWLEKRYDLLQREQKKTTENVQGYQAEIDKQRREVSVRWAALYRRGGLVWTAPALAVALVVQPRQ